MTAFNPGTGGTIVAVTAEGAAFQLFHWWQNQEKNKTINPNEQEFFTGAKNTDTGYFEGKWKLMLTFVPNTPIVIAASSIYQNLIFNSGTGGDITVTTMPEQYTLELMLIIISKQLNTQVNNPDGAKYFTCAIDLNEGTAQGDFKIPFLTTLLPNGGTQDVAREFLL